MKYFADDTAAVKSSGVHHPLEIEVTKETFNMSTEVAVVPISVSINCLPFLTRPCDRCFQISVVNKNL